MIKLFKTKEEKEDELFINRLLSVMRFSSMEINANWVSLNNSDHETIYIGKNSFLYLHRDYDSTLYLFDLFENWNKDKKITSSITKDRDAKAILKSKIVGDEFYRIILKDNRETLNALLSSMEEDWISSDAIREIRSSIETIVRNAGHTAANIANNATVKDETSREAILEREKELLATVNKLTKLAINEDN